MISSRVKVQFERASPKKQRERKHNREDIEEIVAIAIASACGNVEERAANTVTKMLATSSSATASTPQFSESINEVCQKQLPVYLAKLLPRYLSEYGKIVNQAIDVKIAAHCNEHTEVIKNETQQQEEVAKNETKHEEEVPAQKAKRLPKKVATLRPNSEAAPKGSKSKGQLNHWSPCNDS